MVVNDGWSLLRGVVNEGFYCTCVCVMAERRCSAHADVEESDGATLSARKPRDPLSSYIFGDRLSQQGVKATSQNGDNESLYIHDMNNLLLGIITYSQCVCSVQRLLQWVCDVFEIYDNNI